VFFIIYLFEELEEGVEMDIELFLTHAQDAAGEKVESDYGTQDVVQLNWSH